MEVPFDHMVVLVDGVETVRKIECIEVPRRTLSSPPSTMRVLKPVLHDGETLHETLGGPPVIITEGPGERHNRLVKEQEERWRSSGDWFDSCKDPSDF